MVFYQSLTIYLCEYIVGVLLANFWMGASQINNYLKTNYPNLLVFTVVLIRTIIPWKYIYLESFLNTVLIVLSLYAVEQG